VNKVRLLAACAALTLVVAACGDDDDDASGDSAPATNAAPRTAAAPAATAADAEPTTAGTGDPSVAAVEGGGAAATVDTGVDAVPTLPGSDASPEVVADCQAVGEFILGQGEGPDGPSVDEEISDDYKDFLEGVRDGLEDLDLETDEVQSAVDSLVDFSNEAVDADTWTEELESEGVEAFGPLNDACAATLSEMDEAG
jgi:hypothetical protein